MGQPIPAQHPSVVLRSHFKLVKALLAVAMAAVIGLTAAVVILANDEDQLDATTKATPALQQQPQTQPGTRYDGGPDEGTRGAISTPQAVPAGSRYDGGPEEGTRGAIASPAVPKVSPAPSSIAANAESAYENLRSTGSSRYDGGPEEGTRGAISTPHAAPADSRYDGGPEEGTRGPLLGRVGGPR